MSRPVQIALLTAGAVLTGAAAYAVYFDYMRRNSATFRKGLKKEHKKIKKAAEIAAKAQAEKDQRALARALVELELEIPPSGPEQMEAYFQEHVALGEQLAAQGPDEYVQSAAQFYRALRVYPQPVELLMIYQKVCPEPVFQLVLKLTQMTSAVNAGAGAGTAAPPQPPASVADIDDASPASLEPVAPAATAVPAPVEVEEEKEEEEVTAGSPTTTSTNGSGNEWERVSNEA